MAYSLSCLPPRLALALADQSSYYHPPASELPTVCAFLPAVVKSRLPELPLFRRFTKMTASNISTPAHSRVPSEASSHAFTSPTEVYGSPTREIVAGEQPWQVSRQSLGTSAEAMASSPPSSLGSPRNPIPARDRALTCAVHETGSGVDWDTASTAHMLLTEACRRAPYTDFKPENARQLLLTANVWLLRSLPSEMTPGELGQIEEVLPAGLDYRDHLARGDGPNTRLPRRQAKRSWLHRLIASLVLHISIVLAIIIPYATTLANTCYRLERRHHFTERVLTGGIDVTNILGETGMELKDAAVRLGQGRFAGAMMQTGGWVVDSVIGGISDGAGEGVAIVGEAMKLKRERQTQ